MNLYSLLTIQQHMIQRGCYCFLLLIAVPASAQVSFNHSLSVSSDYYIRGLTRTTNDFSFRYGGEIQYDSWFAGLNLINADYPGVGVFADESADYEYTLFAGYFGDISESVSWQTQFAYHEYAGSAIDGDYFEGTVTLHLPYNLSMSYLLTKNEHLTNQYAQYIELDAFQSINRYWVISGSFGFARTDEVLSSNYEYMDVGLSFLIKSFSLDLRKYFTFGSAGRLQPLTSDRFVVSLTKTF